MRWWLLVNLVALGNVQNLTARFSPRYNIQIYLRRIKAVPFNSGVCMY